MDEERVAGLIEFVYTSERNPTADDFADVMGLQEAKTPEFANLDEIAKLPVMCHLLRKFRMMGRVPQNQQDFVYNKLAALHVAAMVDRFLEPPPLPAGAGNDFVEDYKLNNVYVEVLGTISHTPYFAKYLNSDLPAAQGGKQLMRTVAQRLVEVAPSWDQKMLIPQPRREPGYFESAAATAIQMLSTLLAFFTEEPQDSPIRISKELKDQVLPWLRKWERRHSRIFLGKVCERTRSQLEGDMVVTAEAKLMRRMLLNLDRCGKRGCQSKSHLKVCSKCKTVRYITKRQTGSMPRDLTRTFATALITDAVETPLYLLKK
ncbi:hypothetical protein CVT26_002363 [Gymnopilus dilepis]|uniref:Uncharacterized protein n=1 Tax=Gymnopilus dilepis TaxID=231916 RepID=A0A409Y3F0_9AGAR|nr:hypothetical protein CVT26_002363 [Gymnopilus dilepis]